MSRVIAYIDGFNLFHGLRDAGWRRYYWLDVHALGTALLKPGQSLERVHYFTSRISPAPNDPQKHQRQADYIEALGTLTGCSLHFGHYLAKPQNCRKCGATWVRQEEKMTDVNIAVELLTDAMKDRFDTALLLTADSDLVGPIDRTRELFPAKRIIAVFPPHRTSEQLKRHAHGWFRLGEANLRQSQFPPTVVKPDGFTLTRPALWT